MNYQNNPKGRQMFILDELKNNPSLSYLDCFSKFSVVFSKTERTFNEDWKKANLELKQYTETINNAKLEESIKIEKQAVKKAILQKHEALEILTEIAIGKPKKVEGQIIMPSANERRGAIETMAKLEGWEATKKIDHTITTPIINVIAPKENE